MVNVLSVEWKVYVYVIILVQFVIEMYYGGGIGEVVC